MSIRSLNSRVSSMADDADDELTDAHRPPSPPLVRTGDALARAMLDAVLTPRLRGLLGSSSRLILIRTADEAAAKLIDRYLGHLDRSPVVQAYTEPQKIGGRLEPQGRAELEKLEHGRTVILISQDPDRVIVPEALAAADAVITIPHPNLAAIRKTIRMVTGTVARGLTVADVEGLGILDLTAAIRPGLTSKDCVTNLRRAALTRQEPADAGTVIPLEKLAMTQSVSDWAFATADICRHVTEGELDTSALRFACLEGPPGTGKTTVASSLACSAGWGFVSTSVGEWFATSDGNLGGVVRAARRFFDQIALSNGPVVGLLDEVDSLPNRATMDPSDAQWWTPVITFVLTEIDRLRKAGRPVLLLAATNHFSRLDAALVRPGRLERKVSVLLPNEAERCALFAYCLGDTIGAEGLATLGRVSILATPAKIESWCKSAVAAAQTAGRPIELRDLLTLIAPSTDRSAQTDRAIALHEAGHAIVAVELGLAVAEISIISVGGTGGWVNTGHGDGLLTRAEVERLAATMLGGRAADTVLGKGAHAGAASDIENVNALLRRAMLDFGLYGPLSTGANSDLRNWQRGTSLWATIEVKLSRLHDLAVEIVSRRRSDILALVEVLLAERVITGERLAEILGAGTSNGGHGDDLTPGGRL